MKNIESLFLVYSRRKLAVTGVALIISLIVAYRLMGPGRDTESYINFFLNLIKTGPSSEYRYEPLFQLATWSTAYIYFQDNFIFVCLVFVAFLLKCYAILRVGGSWVFFVLIYFTLCMATLEANQIRAAIGISFIYWMLINLERSYLRSLFMGVLAIGFHYSMIFFVAIISAVELFRLFSFRMASGLCALVLSLVSVYLYFEVRPDSSPIISSAFLIADSLDVVEVRIFSVYSSIVFAIYVLTCWSAHRRKHAIPYFFLHSVIIGGVGIAGFFLLAMLALPYPYRVLENSFAVMLLCGSVIYRNVRGYFFNILYILICGVASLYFPTYWIANST